MAQVFAHESERMFWEYLERHNLKYIREFPVNPGNVDFRVESNGSVALCDVKAIVEPPEMAGRVEAHFQIRGDLKCFCNKFARPPESPCVLVSINCSPQIFTGLTVQIAMFGDLGVAFSAEVSEPFHLPKGSAGVTSTTKTRISGILVIDPACGNHCYFPNPYARKPLAAGFFPGVREIRVNREAPCALMGNEDLTFLPSDFNRSGC